MKIGFIDYVFERDLPIGTSGLSEVVWSLAAPLAALGHDVHIAAPYGPGNVPSNAVQVHRFNLPPIGYRNIAGHILIVKRAIATLQQWGRFDVIHAPEYLSTALLTIAQRTTPIVLTEPGNIFERIANGNPYDSITTQVFKWAARTSGCRCARVIATSDEMAYWWNRSGAVPDRIVRIPLGVDLQGFAPQPGARELLGCPEHQRHILFVARLSPETGAAFLVQALPEIVAQFPEAHLHIVGSGPSEPELHALARELNLEQAVTCHGWVKLKELASFYSAADVMVFPGTSGGTPRVMLQAMACGAPFVGAAIGGITDHINHEQTGLLVPPRDVPALAGAICATLADPLAARRRAERAQSYVAGLSWPAIAERVAREVYQPIVGTGETGLAFAG